MSLSEINRRIRAVLWGAPPPVSQELREASHRLNNEATALQAQVHRMVLAEDPFWELAKAMRGEDKKAKHQ